MFTPVAIGWVQDEATIHLDKIVFKGPVRDASTVEQGDGSDLLGCHHIGSLLPGALLPRTEFEHLQALAFSQRLGASFRFHVFPKAVSFGVLYSWKTK